MNLRKTFFFALVTLPPFQLMADDMNIIDTYQKRYSQLPFRETPFADIKGIFPISDKLAQGRKHYLLTYDNLDRVVEMQFLQDGKTVPLNINKNVVTNAPHIKITFSDNKEVRTFFDQFGQATQSNGAFKEVYSLNNKGERVALQFEDKAGNKITNNWGIYQYTWDIDAKGTVTEQRIDKNGQAAKIRPGFPFFCLKLHYDQRGFLAMMENFGKDCKTLTQNNMNAAQDKLTYNKHGFMYSWNVYDAQENRAKGNGPNVATGMMEHDSYGNTTREYYLDEFGNQIHNAYGWFDSVATYDNHGNMSSRFNYDPDGNKARIETLGYSGYKLTYDKQGRNRTSLSYYDQHDKPTMHLQRGYHSVQHFYNAQNQVIKIQFLDLQGRLTNRLDNGIAYIEYEYTAAGLKRINYDKNSKQIN